MRWAEEAGGARGRTGLAWPAMRRRRSVLSSVCSVTFVVSNLVGQGVIVDGNLRWSTGAFPAPGQFAPQPVDFTADGCSADQLFEARWLWRAPGDADARALSDRGHGGFAQTHSGAASTMDWADVDSAGLVDLRQSLVVASTSTASGLCTQTLAVTNISGAPLDLDLFFYVDVDLHDRFDDDLVLAGSDGTRLLIGDDEACAGCVEVRAETAQRFEVGASLALVQNLQNSGQRYDLADRGLSFGPGDLSLAFQWSVSLPVAGVGSVTATVAHNDLFAGSRSTTRSSGFATPGAGGDPSIVPVGLPVLGAPFGLEVVGVGAATRASVMLGVGPQVTVDLCGLILHVSTAFATVDVAAGPNGALRLDYPPVCDPAFAGVPIEHQALALDATSVACLPVVASPLFSVVFGDLP